MNFRSYYTKVIFILIAVFLTLFILLGVIDSLIIERSIKEMLSVAQQPRVYAIFKQLKAIQQNAGTAAQVQKFVDQLFLECQLDVYDSTGHWVAGNQMFSPPDSTLPLAIERVKKQIGGYSARFVSPIAHSLYSDILVTWQPEEPFVLKKALTLLLVSGLITILVAIGVGWMLSSSLNRRLLILQKGVAEIERGNFNIHLNIKGNDEIALLGKRFNRMAQQLRDLIQQLEESNKARQRLIGHATHEMKSPITSIKGFVDIIDYLKLLENNPQGQQLLSTVRKDIQRLVKTVDDLIQLARYQEPNFSIQKERLNLKKLLKEEHKYFEYKARRKKARTLLVMDGGKAVYIQADAARLAQILDNIWSNALKYGDLSEPIVTILQKEKKSVILAISNTLLFPLEVSPDQLFEPFYRHQKHAEKVKGAGLGLAIVKELVEKMDGSIKAEVHDNALHVVMEWPLA